MLAFFWPSLFLPTLATTATPVRPSWSDRLFALLAGRAFSPVTHPTNWQVANSAPQTYNGASDSTQIARLDSLITAPTTTINPISMAGYGTSLLVAGEYNYGLATTGGPVIQVIGYDENYRSHLLSDANGNQNWTLAAASTDVASSATLKQTAFTTIDCYNYPYVAVVIYTASTGSGWSGLNNGAVIAKII